MVPAEPTVRSPIGRWDWRVSGLLANDELLRAVSPGIVTAHTLDVLCDEVRPPARSEPKGPCTIERKATARFNQRAA